MAQSIIDGRSISPSQLHTKDLPINRSRNYQAQGPQQQQELFCFHHTSVSEKLIHLHCTEIKHTLTLQAKKFQQQFREGGFQANIDINSVLQELREGKDKFLDKQTLVAQIDKLFGYLIWIQCHGKSNFEVENIFLEINCSLNYACPLCIKQIHSNEPKSIKLIKNQSEEPETHACPHTMKTISLKEPDRSEKLPSISKHSRLESLLDSMKAERAAIKKQEDSRQRKINKIWNLLGNLIQLDRQKFIVDHIFSQHEEKENRLLKELQQKNVKNKHYISHFCKKKRTNLKEPSLQKIFEDFQDKEQFEKALGQQRKVARSVSPKYPHRKLSVKKHVKILEPINSNINSLQLNSEIKEQKPLLMAPDRKPVKFVFIGENQTLRPTQNKLGQIISIVLSNPQKMCSPPSPVTAANFATIVRDR